MDTSAAPRARRIAHLSPVASELRLATARWALANGRRIDYDALSVILAVMDHHGCGGRRWTEDDVWRLWWIDIGAWCAARGVATPDGLATSLLTLLAHLEATRGFAPGSDSRAELEQAMEAAGALWRSHPASAG